MAKIQKKRLVPRMKFDVLGSRPTERVFPLDMDALASAVEDTAHTGGSVRIRLENIASAHVHESLVRRCQTETRHVVSKRVNDRTLLVWCENR